MTTKLFKAAAVGFTIMSAPSASTAVEIKVVASVGIQAALEELVPQFERSTEHKLKITFGAASELKQQIDGGEAFDVAVLTPAIIDDLIKQGKVAADAHSNVARTWIGMEVRAGAPKPDISTVDALKRTLLGAKSIVYTTTGLGAIPIAHLIEQLGIADELKPKTLVVLQRPTALAVAEGKAELGFALVSEILTIPEVELGPVVI
jgi:molybdate transport system substrate-binding protein